MAARSGFRWTRARLPDVPSARGVDRAQAYGLTAGAVASLNSHTDQDGFTMRTFELPGSDHAGVRVEIARGAPIESATFVR